MKPTECRLHRLQLAMAMAFTMLASSTVSAQATTAEDDVEVIGVTGKRIDSYGLMPTEDSGSALWA